MTTGRGIEVSAETRVTIASEARPLIRLTAEEQQIRAAGMRAALERAAIVEDGADVDDGAFFRALDESHPGRFALEKFH